jgi:hypothetical protein
MSEDGIVDPWTGLPFRKCIQEDVWVNAAHWSYISIAIKDRKRRDRPGKACINLSHWRQCQWRYSYSAALFCLSKYWLSSSAELRMPDVSDPEI